MATGRYIDDIAALLEIFRDQSGCLCVILDTKNMFGWRNHCCGLHERGITRSAPRFEIEPAVDAAPDRRCASYPTERLPQTAAALRRQSGMILDLRTNLTGIS